MKRRQALQTLASAAAALPLLRVRSSDLSAEPWRRRTSSPPTRSSCCATSRRRCCLGHRPQGPGRGGRQLPEVDPRLQGGRGAVAWLRRAAPGEVGPVAGARLREADRRAAAAAQGGAGDSARCRSSRRELLDAAFKAADVRNLPGRPDGKHVVADLMAHYFRSSAANDLCYNARIGRNTYRAIRVTTVRPQPLGVELTPCPSTNPTSASSAAASPPRC